MILSYFQRLNTKRFLKLLSNNYNVQKTPERHFRVFTPQQTQDVFKTSLRQTYKSNIRRQVK